MLFISFQFICVLHIGQYQSAFFFTVFTIWSCPLFACLFPVQVIIWFPSFIPGLNKKKKKKNKNKKNNKKNKKYKKKRRKKKTNNIKKKTKKKNIENKKKQKNRTRTGGTKRTILGSRSALWGLGFKLTCCTARSALLWLFGFKFICCSVKSVQWSKAFFKLTKYSM